MMSNSEWTGVPLATLFREVGVQERRQVVSRRGRRRVPARAQHPDAARRATTRSSSTRRTASRLRPEQGFPIRLLLPGCEGNTNVKWLRRLKLGTEPFMTRWETSKYTDPLPGGKVRHVQLRDGREVDHHVARVSRAAVGAGLVADSRTRLERPRTNHARRRQHGRRKDVGRSRAARRRSTPKAHGALSATCGSGPAMRVCS